MNSRLFLFVLTAVAAIASSTNCDAGGYGDLLYGRTTTPYVAGYTPAVAVPNTFAPLATGGPANAAAQNGAFQVQRPAYDNPSVYTGLPVNQTSYRIPISNSNPFATAYRPVLGNQTVPLARRLRGAGNATSNPFYGTGNIYPNNFQAPGLQIGGTALTATPPPTQLGPITTPVTTFRAPVVGPATVTALSPIASTPIAAPLFTQPQRQPRFGGLARFFASLWGTNYRSRYYRAPITYYRPVTSVDPILGTTVTVQRPCTSYVQQLQRTPYDSLFAQQQIAPANPLGSCNTVPLAAAPQYYAPAPLANTFPLNTMPLAGPPTSSVIGQVGGISSPSDQGVVPIPSTAPGTNTAPLTGNPGAAGDFQSVPQPRLESQRPNIDEVDVNPTPNDSYWKQRRLDADNVDKTALQPLPRGVFSDVNTNSPEVNRQQPLQPIEAPADLRSPFTRQFIQSERPDFRASESYMQEARAPNPIDRARTERVSFERMVPVHEATLSTRARKPALPKKREYHRDNHWQ